MDAATANRIVLVISLSVAVLLVPFGIGTVSADAGTTYADARGDYIAGAQAWGQAWGASDVGLIRQHLNQAKSAYTNCLNAASQTNDPANAANLALVKSVSSAYMALADAALAMYDGADAYGTGRSQMTAGSYAAAAASFQAAGEKFGSSQTLFGQATTTLQSVSYAGTEYGDGTAYTATIVPILNARAAYMGEFAVYARGWQHTALAYQASANGDQATFRREATQAMDLFAGLRSSHTFGADATANYNILQAMVDDGLPTPTPTPTGTATRTPTLTPTPTPSPSVPTSPEISFTSVPPLSSTDTYVSGQASGVERSEYRVTLYVRVRGSWWGPKPDWDSPYTVIAEDGSWRTRFVTGGVDEETSEFAAFLVPVSYDPPDLSWASDLPQELFRYRNAKASR